MRKSLILVATAIGGGVGYAAGVTEVATGPGTGDPFYLALACIVHPRLPRRRGLSTHPETVFSPPPVQPTV